MASTKEFLKELLEAMYGLGKRCCACSDIIRILDDMRRVLRPHHGMCFQFYEGKGYSEDFTDHMGRIIREMDDDPSQKIQLKVETDIVCENCPNNESGECTTADKVKRYDEEVLKACNLVEGEEISFAEFAKMVRDKIINAGIRSDICGDCSWDYICSAK